MIFDVQMWTAKYEMAQRKKITLFEAYFWYYREN